MTDLTNTTIAVTGAGGFVGHSLCRKLFERGARVRMLVRYRSNSPGEHQVDLTNNIMDPAALEPPVRAVVHCAWDSKSHDAAEYKRINVDGTRWLIDRCQQAGVEQFVFVSSMAAHDQTRSIYGRTKLEVEKLLRSLPTASTFSTIVAPGRIIGNGGDFFRTQAAVKKFPVIPAFYALGQQRVQTTFVDDLCDGIIKSIESRITGRLLVAEEKGVKLIDFYRGVVALNGDGKIVLPFPGTPALLTAHLLETLGIKPAVSSSQLRDIQSLQHFHVTASNKLLGSPTWGTYWQSLEKLAVLQNKPEVIEKIRKLAARAG